MRKNGFGGKYFDNGRMKIRLDCPINKFLHNKLLNLYAHTYDCPVN